MPRYDRTVEQSSLGLRLEQPCDAGALGAVPVKALSAVADFVDVDLGVTPVTNTITVRRLDLEIGKRERVTAVWAEFPELAIQPLVTTAAFKMGADRESLDSGLEPVSA